MFYWDIDGVLRLLYCGAFKHEPSYWGETLNGKTLIDIVNEHPEICLSSPPSEYVKVVNRYCKHLHILSNQLPSWTEWTNKWLNKYIEIPYDVRYTNNPFHKISLLGHNDYLVEDYPNFQDYSKIILINRKYNRGIECPIRISKPNELIKIIAKLGD